MDPKNTTICCGCLCSERKMIELEDHQKKECFMEILNDMSSEESWVQLPIWLCWECSAQISHFTRFRKQVKRSYKAFNDYLKQAKWKSPLNIQPFTKLSSHKLYNICIEVQEDDEFSTTILQVIKTENQKEPSPEPDIKEENENDFLDTNSDDEKLIDISKKVAKVKKKKRKRKKIVIYKEIELNTEELQEERRFAMLKEDYVNAMFRCERCIVSFPNAEDLSDHISMKHELNASHYKCTICECSFSSEVSYNYHTNKHTRRYQCVVCSERCTSKRAVIKHFEQNHYHGPAIEFDIHKLQYENGLKTDETEEVKDNSQPVATFACDFCDKIFRWKTSLRKHAETHRIESGQKRKPYCEPCRLSFTTTSNLQKHVKTSSKHQIQLKLRKLTESLPAESTNSEKRQAHIEEIRSSVNSSRQMYPCPQCDKRFQWRGNLLRHVNSHVARANGELVCKPCNRTFSSIATYKQHMKISKKHVSENEFKYVCSDCGKRFANKTRLKDHVDWEHLKNYVHTCSICQKVFKSHTSLYLHRQVVHKKDNAEHLCDHCGKPFPNHAKLRSHITALHSGASAYRCATCGATFSWHSCLSRHARKVHAQRAENAS